jgi:hypothetical protein
MVLVASAIPALAASSQDSLLVATSVITLLTPLRVIGVLVSAGDCPVLSVTSSGCVPI